MADAAKWYVVHTYSGYENKVASSIEKAVENRRLHDLITAVKIPTEKVTEVKDGKSREVERKLFRLRRTGQTRRLGSDSADRGRNHRDGR